jgi:hypothetical protein
MKENIKIGYSEEHLRKQLKNFPWVPSVVDGMPIELRLRLADFEMLNKKQGTGSTTTKLVDIDGKVIATVGKRLVRRKFLWFWTKGFHEITCVESISDTINRCGKNSNIFCIVMYEVVQENILDSFGSTMSKRAFLGNSIPIETPYRRVTIFTISHLS